MLIKENLNVKIRLKEYDKIKLKIETINISFISTT